ncbi:EAL domain-containing protein [Pelagibacterium luteolum]|uniref:Diguanylate cyclase (GGDEF) domain-containing protein n=1 Tax=Pelagibacterium luteolum TaxID=440168 RepID=A0A1G7SEG7_9HYPH|nr:EAL domain-containing protein [Pelagibacterium luteolum]SDG21294.1 diguanylate cyclase (GGDEF) domain-containing protein [Pelagibacterium luteolum]
MVQTPSSERPLDALLLDAALQTIPFGFCVWSAEFELVMWNQHYLDIYGFPKKAIRRGMSLYEVVALSSALGNHPDTDPKSFYDAYTAELLGNRSGLRAINLEMTAGHRTLETAHIYAPGLGWVVTHDDVTEEIARSDMMSERKRELERQYALLDAAINNISQGLSMFDREFRLVTCNTEFVRMYALPEALAEPGTPFEKILEHRDVTGRHAPLDRQSYIAERKRIMKGGTSQREVVKMADGTYIAFRHQPLKGGGLVTTHEDITEQLAAEARMRHMATHDALTDLPNRTLFREDLDVAVKGLESGKALALLTVNLDHFKAINDSDGHAMGDRVLKKIAARLIEIVGARAMVARMASDEFAVLLTPLSSPQAAADLGRAIVKAIAEPIVFGRKTIKLSASIGIAVAPGDGRTTDALLNNADLALLKAKSEGRGTCHFFESGMDATLQRRRTLETGLRDAIANCELSVLFQPLVSLKTGKIAAAEALLRWTHPKLGMIPPVEFIPIAEESGLIHQLGGWVLHQAALAAGKWPKHVGVAVNLSPVQFRQAGLLETVQGALARADLAAERLELEITESLLLEDSQANIDLLHAIRGLGVKIAMDDFGTGYSSLSYLRAFPFDKIKIDRSFMSDIATKDDSRAILRAMIGLGTSLGMVTVAEGVETEEQLAVVKAEGATLVQGYYYSPPVTASDIAAMVEAETVPPATLDKRAG